MPGLAHTAAISLMHTDIKHKGEVEKGARLGWGVSSEGLDTETIILRFLWKEGWAGRGVGGGGVGVITSVFVFTFRCCNALGHAASQQGTLVQTFFLFFFHSQITRADFVLVLHSQTSTSMDGGSSQSVPFVQDDIIGQKKNCP